MDSDTVVSIDVKDERGLLHTGVWKCRMAMVRDRNPEVRFLNRELNVEATAGQSLPLTVEENDDYGITSLELYTVKNGQEQVIKSINYRDVRRERTGVNALSIDENIFARNATYKVWARVFDNHSPTQPGVAPVPLTLHIIDPMREMNTADKDDPYVRLFALLNETLDGQKTLRDWVAAHIDKDRNNKISQVLPQRQAEVHARINEGVTLATGLFEKKKIRKALNESIAELKTDYSYPLMLRIPQVVKFEGDMRQAGLNEVVLKAGIGPSGFVVGGGA